MKELKQEIVENLKLHLGKAWETLSTSDLVIIENTATDAQDLQIRRLKGENIDSEIAIVNAALLNISVAKRFNIRKVFWESVRRAATMTLTAVFQAGVKAILG